MFRWMARPLRITIDTNCINATRKIKAVNTLERWETEGKIQLDATTRLLLETGNHSARRAKSAAMNNIAEPAILGQSFLDVAYIPSLGPQFDQVAAVLFPGMRPDQVEADTNKANDVMHLLSHHDGGGDFFVTNDSKDFIKADRRQLLRARFGIVVMTAAEMVEHLSSEYSWV